ncbi:IS256 family transposase [Amedibacillus sp. YH-ame6]
MNTSFISTQQIKELVNEQKFTSTNDIMQCMKGMFADVLEQTLQAEMDMQLGYDHAQRRTIDGKKNYRNGTVKRTMKTQLGEVDIEVPRDRNGEFEPQIIGKYQRNADGIEERILSLYATGMSTRDIKDQIKGLYDVEISEGLVSKISERILPEVSEWQNRPLEASYPFIFMDAIHYKVRENHQVITKAAYVVLGINDDGCKDVLGLWVGASESAKYWMGVLNELKSRGIKDVSLFCVDGLTGFREAIGAVYPEARIQRCIIHQIRNSTKFVSYKHLKEFMKDLKTVYQATTEEQALNQLSIFKDNWGKLYPTAIRSWEENWDILSTYFDYPVEIRKVIYTTNAIEGLNRQFRKVTKTKTMFPNDDSLRKMLYLAIQNLTSKWTMRYRNWDLISSQLELMKKVAV